jgi:hypothetical protein
MTTTTVARIDHRGRPTVAVLVTGAFAIGLAFGAAVAVFVPTAARVAPGPDVPVAAAPEASTIIETGGLDAYATTLTNIATATVRRDARMAAQFRRQLEALTTPALAADIYARYRELTSDIGTARTQHDLRMLSVFREQLAALCIKPSLVAGQSGCVASDQQR